MRRVVLALLVGSSLLLSAGCNKLKARDNLNKGVQAYKNAKYEDAIERFRDAVNLDPSLVNARLYLATAYAQQYIPGSPSPDNVKFAEQAIDEFKKVLETNPPREAQVGSLKGIASLYFNMKKMDEAKDYYQKVIALDPNDPEVYYSIAVIDWTVAYEPRMKARADAGLKPTDQPDKKVCTELKKSIDKNGPAVQEGIDMLNKALAIRTNYDDAMAYLNLLYREKADLDCTDPEAQKQDLKTADDWVDKTLATKKANAEKKSSAGGIVAEPAQ
jgi:tetratricopeptide (TPR) repeat protein